MAHTAFVLAAGFGTRLRPLTEHLPKPLVPVCGVPMLSYALALCARHGHTDVVVNAHWLAETLAPWQGRHEGVDVTLSVEQPAILGTGGGLKAVASDLGRRVVVVNADILCDVDLSALLAAVPAGGASMAVRPSDELDKYGTVAVDETGTIVQMRKVSVEGKGAVARDTHSTGLHAFDRDVLDRVPDGFACIVGDAYLDLVNEGAIRGVRHEGTWLDVGDPEAYLQANLAVLDGDVVLPLNPHERASYARSSARTWGTAPAGVELIGHVWLGKGAVVNGAVVDHSVVGAGAVVSPGVVLRNCVVWDGVVVPPGRYDGVIFFTSDAAGRHPQ